MNKITYGFILVFIIVGHVSCKTSEETRQQLVYFKNLRDSAINIAKSYEGVVQKGDILGLSVSGAILEKEAAASIISAINGNSAGLETDNATQTGSTSGGSYYVDESGEIKIPFLGIIKVDSLTRKQIEEKIKEKLKKEITEPVVEIRFLNHKVMVLGEVSKPGTQKLVSDRVSILEAIGNAGDLTVNGRRDNILVIRENNGQKEIGRVNLNDGNIFSSPFYFLKQDDVVYVEVNKLKVPYEQNRSLQYIQLGLAVITSISLLINIFK